MEPENWAVEVGPNDRRKFKVVDEKFLRITKVAMGDMKNGEEVKDLHVYYTRDNGDKVVLAILSSQGPREAFTEAALEPYETVELSHGWQEGSVHFSGHFVNVDEMKDFVYFLDVVSDTSEEEEEEEEENRKKRKHTDMTPPTSEECMEIVGRFPGYEEGTTGYMQSLLLFRFHETDRVHFMIPKTHHAKMEYLKAMLKRPENNY